MNNYILSFVGLLMFLSFCFGQNAHTIEGVHPESYVLIPSSEFSKDKDHVYYQGKILIGADPESFAKKELLYAADKNHVYNVNGKIIESADIETFEQKDRFYALNENYVFLDGEIIKGADPQTWKSLEVLGYSQDKDHVYHHTEVLEGSDPFSFEYIQGPYSKDQNNIYYRSKTLKGVDLGTFSLIGDGYSKDINSIYYQDKKLSSVDLNTFEKINDKNLFGNQIDHLYYSADGYVIFGGEILEGVEAEGFGVVSLPDPLLCPMVGQLFGSIDLVLYMDNKGNIYHAGKKINIISNDQMKLKSITFNTISQRNAVLITDNEIVGISRCDANIYFLPERQDRINTAIKEKLTSKIKKEKLRNLLQSLVENTEDYLYAIKSEAIEGAFYRHILRNIDSYY